MQKHLTFLVFSFSFFLCNAQDQYTIDECTMCKYSCNITLPYNGDVTFSEKDVIITNERIAENLSYQIDKVIKYRKSKNGWGRKYRVTDRLGIPLRLEAWVRNNKGMLHVSSKSEVLLSFQLEKH